MKYIIGSKIFLASLLLVLFSVGCRAQDPVLETVQPDLTTEPEPLPVLTPAQTPFIPTPTLTDPTPSVAPLAPTATPVVIDPVCIPFRTQETLPPTSYQDMPTAVLDFLNMGGTLDALDEGLYESGIANQPAASASGDFTGNGKLDVVISIYNPISPSMPPAGQLVIYTCQNGSFELGFSQESPELAGAPGIRYINDLTGDGSQELVTSSPSCGAHTCYEYIEVLAWDGEEFTNRLVGDTDDLPFPVIDIEEQDDGTHDLVVTGSGIGSAGAGPQRDQIRRWSYQKDTGMWMVVEDRLGDSNYRIHLIHDADQAANAGNYDNALRLYQRVISDTTLVDWMNPEREKETLTAYARFKMVVVYQLREQDQFSQMVLQEMEQTYPSSSPQFAYVLMAQAFEDAYVSDGLDAACREARNYARANEENVLAPLGPEEFGYGNPSYSAEDICPW